MNKQTINRLSILIISCTMMGNAEIDIQKNIYDSAEEIMAMDEKMNRAIAEHNRESLDWNDSIKLEVISVNDFEEREDSYILEREIPDFKNTKLEVKLNNGELTISTKTTKIEKTEFSESKTINSSSSSLFLPTDADDTQMKKSYVDGILKIEFPKKGKFKSHN